MKIIVTGATGFLGRRLVANLVAQGHEVLALARSSASADAVREAGAQPVRGDLDDPASLELPAADALLHAAAHFRLAGPRNPYFRTNVEGTKALLAAAKTAGIGRFVHVSAGAVVMDDRGSPISGVDESAPTFPNSFSNYIASKARGEAAVLAANAPEFVTIALRPPGIWGAGDAFCAALPKMVKHRQFAFIGGGDYDYVTCHVDNVAEAAVCALSHGVGGQAYFVNDPEPTTFRAFVSGLAGALGLSVDRAPSIPYRAAWTMGSVMEAIGNIVSPSNDPPISRSMVRLIGRAFVTRDDRARAELGYVGKIGRAEGLSAIGSRTRARRHGAERV